MRGQVPVDAGEGAVDESGQRGQGGPGEKYKLDPNRLMVDGLGWDRPADPKNPFDQAKNRRVEIKVYPAEKQ